MCRTFKIAKSSASAFAFLLLATFLFVAPNRASAIPIHVTSNIDSTMTITMQKSSNVELSGSEALEGGQCN